MRNVQPHPLELLIRRWNTVSITLAIMLAASPLVVADLVSYRRTDQLAVGVVVAIGVACLYLRRRLTPTVLGLGLVLAVLVFVHEGSLLIWGVAAVPIIFITGNRTRRTNIALSVAALGPASIGLLVVVIAGKVTMPVATQLRVDANLPGPTVFRFLPQNVIDSVGEVTAVGIDKHLAQLTLGALLIYGHHVWMRRYGDYQWVSRFTRLDRTTVSILGALVAACMVAVFATGTDWMRWISCYSTAALIVVAFAVLAHDRPRIPTSTTVLTWPQLAVVAYLLTLEPLHEFDPDIPIPDIGVVQRLTTG